MKQATAIAAIKRSILDDRCVFFLGSGVPQEAGLIDTGRLRELLLADLETYSGDRNDLIKIAQAYSKAFKPVVLKKRIQDEILRGLDRHDLDLKTYRIIAKLTQYRSINFITTNWDTLLESCFKGSQARTFFNDADLPFLDPRNTNILKMHGCVTSASTIVVTSDDYDSYAESHSEFCQKIKELMKANTLVIVGYSLSDINFKNLFMSVYQKDQAMRHNVFWLDLHHDKPNIDDWEERGVKYLHFGARDFFSHLSRELGGTRAPRTPGRAQDLRPYFTKINEVTQTFRVLERTAIDDFEFFDDKFRALNYYLPKLVTHARSGLEYYQQRELDSLINKTQKLKELPLAISALIEKNRPRIKVPNLKSISILITTLTSRTNSLLDGLLTELKERRQLLIGRPFERTADKYFSERFDKSVTSLVGAKGFSRYYHLVDLMNNQRNDLIAFLNSRREDLVQREELFRVLWENFALLLLDEYSKKTLEQFSLLRSLLQSEETISTMKMLYVMTLFSEKPSEKGWPEPARVEGDLESKNYSQDDRTVVLQCLTYHFYSDELRGHAISELDISSLWELISFEMYPMASTCAVGQKILKQPDANIQKILFDVKYIDIKQHLGGGGTPTKDLERFLLLFQESPFLLEDRYHSKFVELIDSIANVSNYQISPKFRDLLGSTRILAADLRKATPPDRKTFDALPQATKAKLAHDMLYFYHFVTSPDNNVARMVFGLIKNKDSGFAANVLRNRRANPELLRTIAGHGELMTAYAAKKHLCFNPKAHPSFAGKYVRELHRHDLEQLASSKDANPAMAQMGRKMIGAR